MAGWRKKKKRQSYRSPREDTRPETNERRRLSPRLAVLLVDGVHRALHRAQQRLDLIGRLLEQEAGHKLLHVGASLVNLRGGKKTMKTTRLKLSGLRVSPSLDGERE